MQPDAVPLTELLERLLAILTGLLKALGLEVPEELRAAFLKPDCRPDPEEREQKPSPDRRQPGEGFRTDAGKARPTRLTRPEAANDPAPLPGPSQEATAQGRAAEQVLAAPRSWERSGRSDVERRAGAGRHLRISAEGAGRRRRTTIRTGATVELCSCYYDRAKTIHAIHPIAPHAASVGRPTNLCLAAREPD
jgi:hypothetical protein